MARNGWSFKADNGDGDDAGGFALTTTLSRDTSNKVCGTASFTFPNTPAADTKQGTFFVQYASATAGAHYWRFHLKVTTAPGSDTTIFYAGNSTTPAAFLALKTDRTLQLYASGPSAVGSPSSALTLDTWYCVEVTRTPSGTLAARLDESQFASGTAGSANISGFGLGVNLFGTGETCTSGKWYFDLVAANDTTGSEDNSWPGKDERYEYLFPNAAGDNADGDSGPSTGSSAWSVMDEVPPNDGTDYWALTNGGYVDVNVASPSEVASGDTINGIEVGIRRSAAATQSNTIAGRIKGGSTWSTGSGHTAGSTAWRTNNCESGSTLSANLHWALVNPDDSAAWEYSDLAGVQVGCYASDGNPSPYLTQIYAIVRYVPATTQSRSMSESSSQASSITLSATGTGTVSRSASVPSASASAIQLTAELVSDQQVRALQEASSAASSLTLSAAAAGAVARALQESSASASALTLPASGAGTVSRTLQEAAASASALTLPGAASGFVARTLQEASASGSALQLTAAAIGAAVRSLSEASASGSALTLTVGGSAILSEASSAASAIPLSATGSGTATRALGSGAAGAWSPPIGIPTPDWGANLGNPIDLVTPARPSPWTSEVAGYYYIDFQTGTDSGRTYGYPSAPRLTIPDPLPAGSYVELHGTTSTSQIIRTCNGTSAAWVANTSGPVWIVGQEGSEPTIQCEFIPKGQYVCFEHLKWYMTTPAHGLSLRQHSGSSLDHVMARHMEMYSNNTAYAPAKGSAIGMSGAEGWGFHDYVIYNITVHDYGDYESATEDDIHAFAPGNVVYNVWVVDCTAYRMGGDGIQIGSASVADEYRCYNIYCGRCTFYSNRENAVDIKEADDIVISEVEGYDYSIVDTSDGEGCVIHNGADNVWIIACKFHQCVTGIQTTLQTNCYIVGCEIYNCSEEGIRNWGGVINVIDCSIDDCYTGIHIDSGDYLVGHGNIIRNCNASGYHVYIADSTGASGSDFNYGCIYQPSGSARIVWGDATVRDVAGWKTAFPGEGTGTTEEDPKFTDPATRDYSLQSDSPCIDDSTEASAYDTYYSSFGESIEFDRNGGARPYNGTWDKGAYEYGAVAPTDLPSGSGSSITLSAVGVGTVTRALQEASASASANQLSAAGSGSVTRALQEASAAASANQLSAELLTFFTRALQEASASASAIGMSSPQATPATSSESYHLLPDKLPEWELPHMVIARDERPAKDHGFGSQSRPRRRR